MYRNEIGSEFWEIAASPGERAPSAMQYYVSGRSALYAVIEDIVQERSCKTAYLPSWCCHTMIDPFLRNDLSVKFYPVAFQDGKLVADFNADHNCDIVLLMDWFGYARQPIDQLAKKETALVIQDATHSLLQKQPWSNDADYIFGSYRKWAAIPGAAFARKRNGAWRSKPQGQYGEYLKKRNDGMRMKAAYIREETEQKQPFLELFAEAERMLDENYIGYEADPASLSAASQIQDPCLKEARRRNAAALLFGLREFDFCQPLFAEIQEEDCPLFVPIMVYGGKRDKLREHLIRNDIYCPVHWPLTEHHSNSKETAFLFQTELSLVCDQRYMEKDMDRLLEAIRKF